MKNGPLIHESYSRLFYESEAPLGLFWMGVPIVKCPYDMWMYAEILHDTKPDLVVETGTFMGGSALYLAHIQDIIGHGHVLSIDIQSDKELPDHPRIDFLAGMSSTDPVVLSHVAKHVDGKRCMVILDSAHGYQHVLDEIRRYHKFVSKGCYLIVEDTNVHGYQYAPASDNLEERGGPAEAVKDFQPRNHGFEVDRTKERLRFSQNPGGYLLRVI